MGHCTLLLHISYHFLSTSLHQWGCAAGLHLLQSSWCQMDITRGERSRVSYNGSVRMSTRPLLLILGIAAVTAQGGSLTKMLRLLFSHVLLTYMYWKALHPPHTLFKKSTVRYRRTSIQMKTQKTQLCVDLRKVESRLTKQNNFHSTLDSQH